jgi:hypothetical protein
MSKIAVHPSSYTHACTACGAQLKVYARYFGRTLRCTTCGIEFVAKPPLPQVPSTEPAEREPTPAPIPDVQPVVQPRRRRLWTVLSVVAVVLLGALLLWLGGDRTQGFASDLFTAKKVRTEQGVLQREDGGEIIVALDRETVLELISALEEGDQSAISEIASRPQCIVVGAGTRVRVLERRKRAVETRIRILDGPWASRIVWVPIQWVK